MIEDIIFSLFVLTGVTHLSFFALFRTGLNPDYLRINYTKLHDNDAPITSFLQSRRAGLPPLDVVEAGGKVAELMKNLSQMMSQASQLRSRKVTRMPQKSGALPNDWTEFRFQMLEIKLKLEPYNRDDSLVLDV